MTLLRALAGRLGGESGYSLTELITVMAITGIVLGGLTTIFVSGSRAEMDSNKRFQAQQNARLALTRLRIDAHVAACATVTGGGATVTLSPLSGTSTCPGTASTTWCVLTSPTVTGRYALYRQTGASCAANTAFYIADQLTANTIFSTATAPSGLLQSLTVDLSVDADTKAGGKYRLTDNIVMRNSLRSP